MVNLNIADRYIVGAEQVGTTVLACLQSKKGKHILVTSSIINGRINLLKHAGTPKQGP